MAPGSVDPDRKRALFEATALPFGKALYNTARRLAGSAEDANDLVQETLLRAYRTFENFAPGTNCKAWLFTILYSIHVNQRKRARRAAISVSPDELDTMIPVGEGSDPFALPALDERWGPEIERALGGLAESLRAAVLLVDVQQLSYEEAAAALGWPIGTLRSRLFRARKQLFAALFAYARANGYLRSPARPQ